MREPKLDRLRTLVTIADLGSFVAASEALHLAPPTVSLHVSDLEAQIGAPLLTRVRGPVLPTAIGASLIERARLLLNQSDAMLEDVHRQVMGMSGRVRMSASTPVIAHLLPDVLARLAQAHPGIEVQLSVHTSTDALSMVAQGALDVAVVATPQSKLPNVRIHAWRRDPVMALIPAGWKHPARATPAWLSTKPLILNDARTNLSRITHEWFATAGFQPRARIEHNYNEAIKSLVSAGYGAALLARDTESPDLNPHIVMLPLRPALWRLLGIAHRAQVEPAVRHVLDALSCR
jgi:DNA-binding transcriptional LysR family regulator